MKGKISIISGLLIGLLISYFTLDYRGSSTSLLGVDGKVLNEITELDFSFINNAFIIIVITSGIIYYLLVKLEKSEQKHDNSRN
jgi:heme/copper-type cytochrome/quinol oxidase subunit 2